ncbi:MAG TPA: HNH endonuclease signature motif containing protein [Solirubrobacteraceae bacterium]|nr:HNH endonuclease signature motif containing protein [Solirubrobacteraceae bacterium]
MSRRPLSVARVELLLEALFLQRGIAVEGTVGEAALQWVTETLHLDPWNHFGPERIAHLVAIQLAPREAIRYAPSDPRPRWRIVDGFLATRSDLADDEREAVARLIAGILDDADLARRSAVVPRDRAAACAICRLPFNEEPLSVATRDPYKPIWQAPIELTQPETDHVVPISGVGRHRADNMQVICRACNLAKGDGLTVDVTAELRYAAMDLDRVPRMHLFRLLQWLIMRAGGECDSCGDTNGERTMRPRFDGAPLGRGVMAVRCYDCV